MSKQLDELLFTIRQNPAFKELLDAVLAPDIKPYRQSDNADQHFADHVFRSGMKRQDASWRHFLIGEPTSQQENP